MCLTTKVKEPLIADKDIPVFKVLGKGRSAYFMDYKYKHGKNIPFGNPDVWPFSPSINYSGKMVYGVDSGYLHAFKVTDILTKKGLKEAFFGKKYGNRKEGKIMRMYIPKGTKYYVDYLNEDVVCARCLVWPRFYFLWNIRRKIRENRGF